MPPNFAPLNRTFRSVGGVAKSAAARQRLCGRPIAAPINIVVAVASAIHSVGERRAGSPQKEHDKHNRDEACTHASAG
jgi:hypothetical protein